jgi:hypothetical protein
MASAAWNQENSAPKDSAFLRLQILPIFISDIDYHSNLRSGMRHIEAELLHKAVGRCTGGTLAIHRASLAASLVVLRRVPGEEFLEKIGLYLDFLFLFLEYSRIYFSV